MRLRTGPEVLGLSFRVSDGPGNMDAVTSPSTPSLSLDSSDLSWLRRLARALLRDRIEADDLVQETVLAALESRSGSVGAKRPWLASVARRLAVRRRRSDIRREDRERDHIHGAEGTPADELALAAESAELVVSVARGLPEPFRRTILEHFLMGRSIQEIASAAGERPDTARWRLRRGLELMREALERRGSSGEGPGGGRMAALLPLASLPDGIGVAGSSVGLTGIATVAVTSTALTMKGLLSTVALALCLLGWIVGQRLTAPDRSPELLEAAAPEIAAGDTPLLPQSPPPISEVQGEAERALASQPSTTPRGTPSVRPWFKGRVVDPDGHGIEGAIIYFFDLGSETTGGAAENPRTESGRGGDFRFPSKEVERWLRSKDRTLALGTVANGFLRSTVTDLAQEEPSIEIVMQRGESVDGRVVDRDGRGIQGLNILIHGDFPGANHVSPSRVLFRGSGFNLGGPESAYHQAMSVTGRRGEVELNGLGSGAYTVRSLDPNWVIVEGTKCRAGASGVRWVAHERFGVRLIATLSGEPIRESELGPRGQFRATFLVELEMEDGSTIDTGQWLGGGDGAATFALMNDADPRVDPSKVRAARFYGTARLGTSKLGKEEKEWTAKRQVRGDRKDGAPEVVVDFDGTFQNGPSDPQPVLDAAIELDVRFLGSGAPFTGRLIVDWASEASGGAEVSDSVPAERLPSGRYRLAVPSGKVQLRVADGQASGSLAAWEGEVDCGSGQTEDVFLELTQGAAATIVRPSDADGEWFVRAAYRAHESEDWFGSWNYSTSEATLRLSALRPAEWRFQLRAKRGDKEPITEHIVVLAEGDETVVR